MRDLDAGRVHIEHKRGDLVFRFAVHYFRRRFRHHHDHARFYAIRAPELFAIEDETLAVGRWLCLRFHFCGIRADLYFREGERGNLAARDPRQKPALLLVGSKQNQRLRHADRLMRRKKRCEIAAKASQPAKLRRNLNPERTHAREFLDHGLRDFAGAVDFIRINALFQKCFELLEKRSAVVAVFCALGRKRMNLREIKTADEKAARETLFRLRGLACRFGELERFALRGRHFRSVDDGFRINCRHRISLQIRTFA